MIAQSVEQSTVNAWVTRSSPGRGAILFYLTRSLMKTLIALFLVVGLSGCVLESQEDLYVKECIPIKKQENLDWAKSIQEMCAQQRTQYVCNLARETEKNVKNVTDHQLRYHCLRSIHIKEG